MKKSWISIILLVSMLWMTSCTVHAENSQGTEGTVLQITQKEYIRGNGRDMVEGAIIENDGGILLYGWTTSTEWNLPVDVKEYPSSRDAIAIKLSPEGSVRWFSITGNDNKECMMSYIGAAQTEKTIILCHQMQMDYTWDTSYGITIMDKEGEIINQFGLEGCIVHDTCANGDSLMICGHRIQAGEWEPFIYSIGSDGTYQWEYTAKQYSNDTGTKPDGAFDSISCNGEGYIASVLQYRDDSTELLLFQNTGELIRHKKVDALNATTAWITDNQYGIRGYRLYTFSTISFSIVEDYMGIINEPMISGTRITIPIDCGYALTNLIEKDQFLYGLFQYDLQTDKSNVLLCSEGENSWTCEGGRIISRDKFVLYGDVWSEAEYGESDIVVIYGIVE